MVLSHRKGLEPEIGASLQRLPFQKLLVRGAVLVPVIFPAQKFGRIESSEVRRSVPAQCSFAAPVLPPRAFLLDPARSCSFAVAFDTVPIHASEGANPGRRNEWNCRNTLWTFWFVLFARRGWNC